VTDSGGIQEEATAPPIRKPVLITRISTERPEAVEAGFAEVVGVREQKILHSMKKRIDAPRKLPNVSPYGDGNAAERIGRIIYEEENLKTD